MTATRRSFLAGAAGASALTVAAQAETVGAFPRLPDGQPLLGPAEGVALLSGNENPYGPAPSAVAAMDAAARKSAYYAVRAEPLLAAMIAERHGLSPENVVVSTGSAEALCAAAIHFGRNGPIVAPRLFFDAAPLYAQRLGMAEIRRVPMRPDLGVDVPGLEAAVDETAGLVMIVNPNNPTARLIAPDALKPAVVRMAAKVPVLIDEAYLELTDAGEANGCVDLVRAGHDVIVARTFSKIYGMAGARVGYLLAPVQIAQALKMTKMSWMSGIGLAGAIASYDDIAFLARSKAIVREAREMVQARLRALGLEALPSQTNFVYFRSGVAADALQAALAARGIVIRGAYMDYADWSRVSMGRLEDVARFCEALPAAMETAGA